NRDEPRAAKDRWRRGSWPNEIVVAEETRVEQPFANALTNLFHLPPLLDTLRVAPIVRACAIDRRIAMARAEAIRLVLVLVTNALHVIDDRERVLHRRVARAFTCGLRCELIRCVELRE